MGSGTSFVEPTKKDTGIMEGLPTLSRLSIVFACGRWHLLTLVERLAALSASGDLISSAGRRRPPVRVAGALILALC